MTADKDFKRVVRRRMAKTGESYTSARATLLDKASPRTHRAGVSAPRVPLVPPRDAPPVAPPLAPPSAAPDKLAKVSTRDPDALAKVAGMSNKALMARTGCAWDTWVFVLDKAKAHEWSHTEIARFVAARYKVTGWWAQTVTVGYERIRGLQPGAPARALASGRAGHDA